MPLLRPRRGTAPRAARAIRIRVRGGYEPDTIRASVGEPVLLTFRREERAPCSERVVFPDFGRSAMLPPYQDVAIELLPRRPGTYDFTCELGVLRGRLVVEERRCSGSGHAR